MKYELTEHARDVIKEREIEISWLEKVLFFPSFIEPDEDDFELEHRLGVISEFGNRVLRVIINKEVEPFRIITVYFDKKMKGKL